MIELLMLLGGLGAGKTTFLNNLIRHPLICSQKVCLLINEFGEIGIDGHLIESYSFPILEINKGSLFCACVETDFIQTLQMIQSKIRPQLVIAEASGMAAPRDLETFVSVPQLKDIFQIKAFWTIVDSVHIIQQLALLQTIVEQIKRADALLLSKRDRIQQAQEQQIRALLTQYNPNAPLYNLDHGRLSDQDLVNLWELRHRPQEGEELHQPVDPVFSMVLEVPSTITYDSFLRFIQELGPNLLRMKGFVDFGKGPELIEWVNGDIHRRSVEKIPASFSGHQKIVIIAYHIRQQAVKELIQRLW